MYKPQYSITLHLAIQTETFMHVLIIILILCSNAKLILFLNAQNYGILYILMFEIFDS